MDHAVVFIVLDIAKKKNIKYSEQLSNAEIAEVFLDDTRDVYFCDTCVYSPRNLNKIECAECDDYDNYKGIIK